MRPANYSSAPGGGAPSPRRREFFVSVNQLTSFDLETNLSGVFAIGDVRSGSVKRVAAAVGEGAQVVAALHAFLAERGDRAALPANTGRY